MRLPLPLNFFFLENWATKEPLMLSIHPGVNVEAKKKKWKQGCVMAQQIFPRAPSWCWKHSCRDALEGGLLPTVTNLG